MTVVVACGAARIGVAHTCVDSFLPRGEAREGMAYAVIGDHVWTDCLCWDMFGLR